MLAVDHFFQRGITIPRFVGIEGAAKGFSLYFWSKNVFVIGSYEKCDFVLPAQYEVAPRHLQVELDHVGALLIDLSGGHTYVNGELVDMVYLQEGDHVRIGGPNVFVYQPRRVEEKNFLHIQEEIERYRSFFSPVQAPAWLEVLCGIGEGLRFPLEGDGPFTLGRGSCNYIKILDSKISRQHAVIRKEDDQYILQDLGSTNGTLVQGKVIDQVVLQPGDHIRLGLTVLEFQKQAPKEA